MSSSDKRGRLKRACDYCRRSKIKCDAAERYPETCSNCAEKRHSGERETPCTFVDGAPKKRHTYAYVRSLEERVKELEGKLGVGTSESLHKKRRVNSVVYSSTHAQEPDSDSEYSNIVRSMWLSGEQTPHSQENLREFGMASNKGLFALATGFVDSRQSLIKANGHVVTSTKHYNQHYNESDFGESALYHSHTSADAYLHTYSHKAPNALLMPSLTVHSIQAVVLEALAMQNTQKYCRSCWSVIGLGVLLAEDSRLDKAQCEDGKRALWGLYILDKSYAISCGRRVLRDGIDMAKPESINIKQDTSITYFNNMIDLYALVADVVSLQRSKVVSVDMVDSLNGRLDEWGKRCCQKSLHLPSQQQCLKVVGYGVVKIFINKKYLKTQSTSGLNLCVDAAKSILSTLYYLHYESGFVVNYTDALLNWSPITASGIMILSVCTLRSAQQPYEQHMSYVDIAMQVLRAKSLTDGVVRKAYELFQGLIDTLQLRCAQPSLAPSVTGWLDECMRDCNNPLNAAELDSDWVSFLNEIFADKTV
ncbi:hypothetical protein E3P89_04082 [Wallemia ichthyophaga]|uniref:Zn(2)-C6 fungal-type domain-containing protein n=1 Tax=Wallemia ichthyophaga TaxID=245174 RepID=A0A4T0GXV7_WALIC|nr:hypothetical protein E3P93_04088 [Wallemia ichthyophaga]TIB07389.1 hypothetical protein E3P90_04085 [Wallemia ichthyophaga]TIB19311.1 hypothetical protein E3P89_04082 [Wallemia ichthyophaga]TIB19938.1 hypothetical protein E3P88_04094 [Wallemia ichthyophaga]